MHIMEADDTFLTAFEDGSFPFAEWRHRAHIKVAYLYLTRFDFTTARERVRAGIQTYNRAHKVPEGPDRGYHDTVTVAWMHLVHVTLQQHGGAATADAFLDAHPELLEKKVLRFFYSASRITSPEAKARFIEPDLTNFPRWSNPVPHSES